MELRQPYREAADFAAEAELRREATYHLRDRPISVARLQNELVHDDSDLLFPG